MCWHLSVVFLDLLRHISALDSFTILLRARCALLQHLHSVDSVVLGIYWGRYRGCCFLAHNDTLHIS